MKTELTAMDVRFITRELHKSLTGGVIRKVYQWGPELLLELWLPTAGERLLLIEAGRRMHLTRYRKEAPQQPPNFCMLLRKHLLGKTIVSVAQHEFDRIVEVTIDGYVLVIELFSKGNVILCGKDYNIIMPMSVQKWKDRTVKSGVPYHYPPSGPNFYGLDFQQFQHIAQHSDREVVRLLATEFGFGGVAAEELCSRSSVPKLAPSKSLDVRQLMRIFENAHGMDREKPAPRIVMENGVPADVTPFVFGVAGATSKSFASFCEAVDEFFAYWTEKKHEATAQQAVEKEAEKRKRISTEQQQAAKKWEKIAAECRAAGDAIYNNYATAEAVLNAINRARNAGMGWVEIKQRMAAEETPIKEISESDGRVTVELSGVEVELDMRKSPEENAAKYYDDMKWAKKKLESVMAVVETEKLVVAQPQKPAPVLRPRKKWYERFRWFETSDGFLVVGGKDAATNERLVKKHAEQQDLVFHADITGAPFVVVKPQGKPVTETAMKEAAEFAAAYSKAWAAGLGAVDVYCVRPEQLSKAAPAGEFLPKGAFTVEGKRVWFNNVELKLSVGIKIMEGQARVVAGPVMAVRKHSDYFVTVVPGIKTASELAKELKNKIIVKALPEHHPLIDAIPLEEWQNTIPAGKGEILG